MLQRLVWRLLLTSLLFAGLSTSSLASEYDHTITVEKMSFSWSIQGENLAGKISAKTESWVGVGFNPSNKMKDANFIVGYVKKGKAKVSDEFGQTATGHKSDKKVGGKDDVTLVSGVEEKGMTTIEFVIPLDSGDEKDQPLDIDGDTTVLLAYGVGRDSFRAKHKFHATMVVNLSTGETK